MADGVPQASEVIGALRRAIDAGVEAEDAIGAIVAAPEAPAGSSWSRMVAGLARWHRQTAAVPSGDQVRRVCQHLDAYAVALGELAAGVGVDAVHHQAEDAIGWSDRLWAGEATAAEVANKLRSSMATLHRLRTNAILRRPIDGPTN